MRFFCRHHGLSTWAALRLLCCKIVVQRWNEFYVDVHGCGIGIRCATSRYVTQLQQGYWQGGFRISLRILNRAFGIERSN